MLAAAVLLVGSPASNHGLYRSDEVRSDEVRGDEVPMGVETSDLLAGNQIACLEILGESILDRTIHRLRAAGLSAISVIADARSCERFPALASRPTEMRRPGEGWASAERKLREYAETGVENVLVIRLGAYAEFDLRELMEFHRNQGRMATQLIATQGYDRLGPLDFWVVNAARFLRSSLKFKTLTQQPNETSVSPYLLGGYVNRLRHARDLRCLVVDAFHSRCAIKPVGIEAKPGVWVGADARIHRRARVVAPAYIGRGTHVQAFALVTRFSSLESGCKIDCSTVVEDSSILANTYIGPGLDVCHSVVSGATLAHLGHNVTVEINDRKLTGKTTLPPSVGRGSRTASSGGASSRGMFDGLLTAGWRRQIMSLTGMSPWAP